MSTNDLYNLSLKELVQFCKDNNVPGYSYHAGNNKGHFTEYVIEYLKRYPDKPEYGDIKEEIIIKPVECDEEWVMKNGYKRLVLFCLLNKIPKYGTYRNCFELREFILAYSKYSIANAGKKVKTQTFHSPNYHYSRNNPNYKISELKPLNFI